jgi:hypothetical protein
MIPVQISRRAQKLESKTAALAPASMILGMVSKVR